MNFNEHYRFEGKHAPFSPSQPYWLRYSEEKVLEVFVNMQAAQKGTRLHNWAKETIDLGLRQPRSRKTIYAYVNDAIGFGMHTEVVLWYSERFFGTADAISYSEKKKFLRIHDLKTGKNPGNMEQLMVYAALFCLEYSKNPNNIGMELRIYQNDEIVVYSPEPEEIKEIMDTIVHFDKLIAREFQI